MTQFKPLGPDFSVAAQIEIADVARAAAEGYTHIVNNRPDGEQPGQPDSATIADAARAAGLGYSFIPVSPGGMSLEQVKSLAEVLERQSERVLAFCRSGNRSALLWGLAKASTGAEPSALAAAAAAQGYDLGPVLGAMQQLQQGQAG
ncbi:MAG: TIGR01244 family sulfur transferase [Sphingomonadaceae bacterium]